MTKQNNNGISFPGALTIAFIVLKLTHVIAWSWLWVLAPMWASVAFVLGILVIAFGVVFLREWLYDRRTWRRRRRLNANWHRR